MIDLRHMRHAVLLAERGTYAAAAFELGITQPALTRSIQAIEARYGIALFDRGRSGAVPTHAGEDFLQRARILLEEARALDRSMAEQRDGLSGDVRFGVGPLVASATLPVTLPGIMAEYPALELKVTVNDAATLLQQLAAGRIQFAIGPALAAQQGEFAVEILGRLPLCFVARAAHPLGGRRVTAAEAASFPHIGGNFDGPLHVTGAPAGYRPALSCDNYEILRGLVETADYLWITSPAVVAAELAEGRMIRIDCPERLMDSYEVALATRRRGAISRAARKVAQRLSATLAAHFIPQAEASADQLAASS